MQKLKATVTINLELRTGESSDEAENRLYDLLFDALCRDVEHTADFWIEGAEEID